MNKEEFIKLVESGGGFGVAKLGNKLIEGSITPLSIDPVNDGKFIGKSSLNIINVYPIDHDWILYKNKKKIKVAPYDYIISRGWKFEPARCFTRDMYKSDEDFLRQNKKDEIIKFVRRTDLEVEI